jgi:hypothetical protein
MDPPTGALTIPRECGQRAARPAFRILPPNPFPPMPPTGG